MFILVFLPFNFYDQIYYIIEQRKLIRYAGFIVFKAINFFNDHPNGSVNTFFLSNFIEQRNYHNSRVNSRKQNSYCYFD